MPGRVTKALDKANMQATLTIERCGLSHLLETPATFSAGSLY